jgi:hypothetical protein
MGITVEELPVLASVRIAFTNTFFIVLFTIMPEISKQHNFVKKMVARTTKQCMNQTF